MQRIAILILGCLVNLEGRRVPELRRYSSPEVGSWTRSSICSPVRPLVEAISSRTSTKF
jgi:hypothetical protein